MFICDKYLQGITSLSKSNYGFRLIIIEIKMCMVSDTKYDTTNSFHFDTLLGVDQICQFNRLGSIMCKPNWIDVSRSRWLFIIYDGLVVL